MYKNTQKHTQGSEPKLSEQKKKSQVGDSSVYKANYRFTHFCFRFRKSIYCSGV